MITPEEIRAKALRHWNSHTYHRDRLAGLPWQALTVPFGKPGGRELLSGYATIADAMRALRASSKEVSGYGYVIEFEAIAHRQLGEQQLPKRIFFETEPDFLRFIGKAREAAQFERLACLTGERLPVLSGLLHTRPRLLLDYLPVWEKLLSVAAWFVAHPRPGIYLRQIDLPGIDSKFIERHVAPLTVLLDAVLPDATVAREEKDFERRYGLRYDQHLIRLRLLDPALSLAELPLKNLDDITIPLEDFQRLHPPVETVFVTENKVNGLAFPPFPNALVVFGLGYGLSSLAATPWLHRTRLVYWGDIDTHGYVILARFRAVFPHVESMLMDIHTLEANRALCVVEDKPAEGIPTALTPEEAAACAALTQPDGATLRLEQERIPYGQVEVSLRQRRESRGAM
ncbi:MAG: Wadjet anti-phage system protein JetD domain-containing protein [Sulfuricellaceae bacterium]